MSAPPSALPAAWVPLLASASGAAEIALAGGGAVAVIAVLALAMHRREQLFPLLAVLALPFRVPISTGGRTVNLLVPLYLVVAAGTLVRLLAALLGARRPAAADRDVAPGLQRAGCDLGGGEAVTGDPHPVRAATRAAERTSTASAGSRLRDAASQLPSPRGVLLLLLLAVLLYALQAVYSADRTKAAENVVFFYVPFGLLLANLHTVRWTRELLLRCLAIAVVLAVLFAGIGFVEYARRSLFLNPKVVAANQYDNYFRVNSLFFDPNIYGRFLALVMIAVTTVVLWSRRRREVLVGAAVLLWLLCGLVTSFSQSSIAALLLGLTALAAWRWDVRVTLYVAGSLVALAFALVLLAPPSLHFGLKGSSGSTSNATSGRTKLISGGLDLFAARPLQGYGSGSFETEYRRHERQSSENATTASHTIPVTVAAEQGLIGLVVYAALIVSALLVLFRGAGRSPPRMALAACFTALLLHTWTYADFLEDPFTWALLGIGLALAGPGTRERARDRRGPAAAAPPGSSF